MIVSSLITKQDETIIEYFKNSFDCSIAKISDDEILKFCKTNIIEKIKSLDCESYVPFFRKICRELGDFLRSYEQDFFVLSLVKKTKQLKH